MSATEGITKVRRRGHVVVPNAVVFNRELSYNALGVLAILLALPEDAPKGYRILMRPGTGQKAILAAFRELRAEGHRYQFLRKGKNSYGKAAVYTDTYVSDEPMTLEEAKRLHFETTGEVAIDMPDRKSKGSLASLCDAHRSDAHTSAAHKRDAQDKSLPAVGSAHSSPATEKLQRGTTGTPENAPQTMPSPPARRLLDDATEPRRWGITPEQAAINSQGAAKVREAMRNAAHQPQLAGSKEALDVRV